MRTPTTVTGRIPLLDVARFFGMFLVYYGHIVERIMYLKNPTALAQYKFINAFHMPFFILVAGFTLAPEKTLLPIGRFFKRTMTSRMLPYFFFAIVVSAMSLVFTGWYPAVDPYKPGGYLEGAISTLMGFPVFAVPLWFMACLVSVEVIHYAVGRFLDSTLKLALAAVVFYVGGYYLTLKVNLLTGATYWLAHEALVMYPFYLIGVFMRREAILLGAQPRWRLLVASALCFVAALLTVDMNTGPFQLMQMVVIVLSNHGNILLFPFTALTACFFLLLLAKTAGANRFFMFLGRNSLILFCLNAVFYHFLNGPFADWFVKTMPAHWASVTGASLLFTLFSFAVCLPVIWFFNTYLPQLVGQPKKKGPILPSLLRGER